MTDAGMLEALKVDLGTRSTAYDERFGQMIASAKDLIKREGINLTDSMEDAELVVMYAAYLWRTRNNPETMPRMLRYALNNRLFDQKMKEAH